MSADNSSELTEIPGIPSENLLSDSEESDWLPSLNPSRLGDFTAPDLDLVGVDFSWNVKHAQYRCSPSMSVRTATKNVGGL